MADVPSSRRRLLGRAALVVAAALAALGIAEGVLRSTMEPRFARAHELVRREGAGFGPVEPRGPIPYRLERIEPSEEGIRIETADGVREHSWRPAPGRARIVGLGDSNTEIWNLPGYRPWPDRLDEALPGTEVIGLGVGGWNTRAEVAWLHDDLARLWADVLLLQVSPNDAERIVVRPRDRDELRMASPCPLPDAVRFGPEDPRGRWDGYDVLSFDCVERDFAALPFGGRLLWLWDWHLGGASAARVIAVDRAQRDALWRLSHWARAHEAALLAVLFPVLEDRAQIELAHQKALLEELDIGYLDLTEAFAERGLEGLRRDPDDSLHPGDEGHALAAEEIARALRARDLLP